MSTRVRQTYLHTDANIECQTFTYFSSRSRNRVSNTLFGLELETAPCAFQVFFGMENIDADAIIQEKDMAYSYYTCEGLNVPAVKLLGATGAVVSGCPSSHVIFKGLPVKPLSFLHASS